MRRQRAHHESTLQRIYVEFMEMPGVRLTCAQAQRLWGLDEPTCRQLLEALVEARFLTRTNSGAYARLTEGRAVSPGANVQMLVRL
jgi:hypothetical protein